jgi:hypothetical protein
MILQKRLETAMMKICGNWRKWNCLSLEEKRTLLEKELTKLLIPKGSAG